MTALEALLLRQENRGTVQFCKTVFATKQRLFRKLVADKLDGCEQVVMTEFLNLWFRHSHKNAPIAMSATGMVKRIGWSLRRVKTVMQTLIAKGFLRVAFGGSGRGNVRNFAVDLVAIREALAPDILGSDKGCNPAVPYNKELLIGRTWLWFAGLVGRTQDFRRRLGLALRADERATWRSFLGLSSHTGQRQANFSRTTGDVEAGV